MHWTPFSWTVKISTWMCCTWTTRPAFLFRSFQMAIWATHCSLGWWSWTDWTTTMTHSRTGYLTLFPVWPSTSSAVELFSRSLSPLVRILKKNWIRNRQEISTSTTRFTTVPAFVLKSRLKKTNSSSAASTRAPRGLKFPSVPSTSPEAPSP